MAPCQIPKSITDAQRDGKRIVFLSGNFNVVHPGHLRLINFAKTFGDFLVIGLFDDDHEGVLVNFLNRKSTILNIQAVDEAILIPSGSLLELLEKLRPRVIVKGAEYKNKVNVEANIIHQIGCQLIFSSGDLIFSSRDLIKPELTFAQRTSLTHDIRFLRQRNVSFDRLTTLVHNFSTKNVLVIGDLIIDEYVSCEPIGMSQEDPTIVVAPLKSQKFLGGAGIVAAHLKCMGASTTFLSLVGDDECAQHSGEFLSNYGVNHVLLTDKTRPTTLKQRIRAKNKTLLRINHLRSHVIDEHLEKILFHKILEEIPTIDAVIFSDFNYGLISDHLISQVSRVCTDRKIPFFADSQSSSQFGNIARFKGSKVSCATERELQIAKADFRSGVQHLANSFLSETEVQGLIVKLGAEGLIAVDKPYEFDTDKVCALNSNPVDTAGAGDALLAATSLSSICGGSLWESAYLGAIAAGLQVASLGNVPVSVEHILAAISTD